MFLEALFTTEVTSKTQADLCYHKSFLFPIKTSFYGRNDRLGDAERSGGFSDSAAGRKAPPYFCLLSVGRPDNAGPTPWARFLVLDKPRLCRRGLRKFPQNIGQRAIFVISIS